MENKNLNFSLIIFIVIIIFAVNQSASFHVEYLLWTLFYLYLLFYGIKLLSNKEPNAQKNKLLILLGMIIVFTFYIVENKPHLYIKDLIEGEVVEELYISDYYDVRTSSKGYSVHYYIINDKKYEIADKSIIKNKQVKENIQTKKQITYLKNSQVILKVE